MPSRRASLFCQALLSGRVYLSITSLTNLAREFPQLLDCGKRFPRQPQQQVVTSPGAGSSLQGKQTLPLLAILADQGASWSALQASDHLLWSPKGKQAGRDSLQPDWPSVLGLLPCPLPEGSLMASRYPAVQGST